MNSLNRMKPRAAALACLFTCLFAFLLSCLFGLAHPAHASPAITASSFLESFYQDRTKQNPIGYHDVLMGDKYHLYFHFTSSAPDDYRGWTAQRVGRELLPLLEGLACESTSKARPGNDPDWQEFRKAGGALVVHLAHTDDPQFKVSVDLPRKAKGARCR